MCNLAATLYSQEQWKEAEEQFVQVVEVSSTVLGKQYPLTLTNMHNLAATYENQGRWEEAEKLLI